MACHNLGTDNVINLIAQFFSIIRVIFIKIQKTWIEKIVRNRFGVQPLAQTGEDLEQWLNGSLGQEILSEEKSLIDEALSDLYGFHLMQLGISRDIDLTEASTINHRFTFTPSIIDASLNDVSMSSALKNKTNDQASSTNNSSASPKTDSNKKMFSALADIEKIPLGSETIDVALLHHVLEFTEHPHQLLRETARVIIPRGYVVVVGFNPFSWFGVFKKFGRWFTKNTLWRHHSLRLGRVVDWLALLDFEPVSIEQGFYRWPIDHPSVMQKTRWFEQFAKKTKLPLGGFYIIVARKEVVGMTPIKPSWKKFNPIESLVGSRSRSGAATTDAATDMARDDSQKEQKLSPEASHRSIH